MNISFDGIISNTLPNEGAGSFFKRGRNNDQGPDQNKRVRRAPYHGVSSPNDGAIQQADSVDMSDDSFSSGASLDELAETLREVNQRLDSSLMLDFSSNNNNTASSYGGSGMMIRSSTGMNTSIDHHIRLLDYGSSSGMSTNGGGGGGGSTTMMTSTNSAPLSASRGGPPPLMNFARIARDQDNLDRL
jgi:hypothetical protein